MLQVTYCDLPILVVNVYMSASGRSKEYRPLLQRLRAHVAPNPRMVLVGGDFECNPRWSADCVSVHIGIASVLLNFVVNMHLQLFVPVMQAPTWVSAHGFVRDADFVLVHNASTEVGIVYVECKALFPLDHCPVLLRLHTLPALTAPGYPLERPLYKIGSSASEQH